VPRPLFLSTRDRVIVVTPLPAQPTTAARKASAGRRRTIPRFGHGEPGRSARLGRRGACGPSSDRPDGYDRRVLLLDVSDPNGVDMVASDFTLTAAALTKADEGVGARK